MSRQKGSPQAEDPLAGRTDNERLVAWVRVHGFLPLALPPLVLAAGLACCGAVLSYRSPAGGIQPILWSLVTMSIALAAAAMALGWYSNRWRLVAIHRRLEELITTGKTEPVALGGAGEMTSLVAMLNVYVGQLQNRSARLGLQKKELDIQTRIAEAEKRCVETVVEQIEEPVVVTDAFDEVVLVNRPAQELFGYTLGASHRQPIHQAMRNPAVVQLIKSMRNPNEPAQRNMTVRLNSDTARPRSYRVSLTRVVDPRGHIHGVVTVLRAAKRTASPHAE